MDTSDVTAKTGLVALRKESVDRNTSPAKFGMSLPTVALRKESVDRNKIGIAPIDGIIGVALRKESVDRNAAGSWRLVINPSSLSARRAWIEIHSAAIRLAVLSCRSPQGERG